MPPTDGFLERTLPDLSRSRRHKSSATSSTYGSVNLSENSSAVVGNVVHQYFYGGRPSVHSYADIDEDGGSRSVELRSICTSSPEARFCPLITIADSLSKVQAEAISNYDHRHAHRLRSQRRITNTCNWIMELVEFKDWVTGTGPPILICVGSRQ
jgi:hypothetical protein